MAEPVFKLLRCDAEASHMLGWAKKEVRRLVNYASLDAFNRTWKFGDVSVRAQYFGGVARLWLEAAAAERLAVWVDPVDVLQGPSTRGALYSYGWENWVYRQAVTFSIWRDDGAVLYDKVWGDYTDANPATTPYIFATTTAFSVMVGGALPPLRRVPFGMQFVAEMYLDGSATYEVFFTVARPGGVLVRTYTLEASGRISSGIFAGAAAAYLGPMTEEYVGGHTAATGVVAGSWFEFHNLPPTGAPAAPTEIRYYIVDDGGVVRVEHVATLDSGTSYYLATTVDRVFESLTTSEQAAVVGLIGAAPPAVAKMLRLYSLWFDGSTWTGSWRYLDISAAFTPEYETPEAPVDIPAWVTQLQAGMLPGRVEQAVRGSVPRSEYTYKKAELTAEYTSVTPRIVRMSYTWTDADGNTHDEVETISGSRAATGPIGGVGSVVPLYDLAAYGVYSEHTEEFSTYAMQFDGFSRPYSTKNLAYIAVATETLPPIVGGVRGVKGAAAERLVIASGAYSGGTLGAYNTEYNIPTSSVLGNVFPDRLYSGDANSLSLDLTGFSLAVPQITQTFFNLYTAKNDKVAVIPAGGYKYTGFFMEPGMTATIIPVRLTARAAGAQTYTVLYAARATYTPADTFSVGTIQALNKTVVIEGVDSGDEGAFPDVGSVRALIIYGGIKWDDVKEEARAQRKALADPNDPAHDPLMKAVLDALTPQE